MSLRCNLDDVTVGLLLIQSAASTSLTSAAGPGAGHEAQERIFSVLVSGTGTIPNAGCKLTECDTVGGSYTDVPATEFAKDNEGDLVAGTSGELQLGYLGRKPFVKVVTPAPSAGTPNVAVVAVSRGLRLNKVAAALPVGPA